MTDRGNDRRGHPASGLRSRHGIGPSGQPAMRTRCRPSPPAWRKPSAPAATRLLAPFHHRRRRSCVGVNTRCRGHRDRPPHGLDGLTRRRVEDVVYEVSAQPPLPNGDPGRGQPPALMADRSPSRLPPAMSPRPTGNRPRVPARLRRRRHPKKPARRSRRDCSRLLRLGPRPRPSRWRPDRFGSLRYPDGSSVSSSSRLSPSRDRAS